MWRKWKSLAPPTRHVPHSFLIGDVDDAELDGLDAELCGPCSCSSVEEQVYETLSLADHWPESDYIVCGQCQPVKFKSEGGFGADDLCSLCPAGECIS